MGDCRICGKPLDVIMGDVCCSCNAGYRHGTCRECDAHVATALDEPWDGHCRSCLMALAMSTVPEPIWAVVDPLILGRQVLYVLKELRERLGGLTLRDAIDLFDARYAHLRRERPGDFTCDPDEYWDGVYS